MVTTAISDYLETLRVLLGDHDATVRQYPDEVLAAAVRTCIRLNRLPGYTLASDLEITPALTDPNDWALVAYHTVKLFVANNPDRYSYKTRAMSETFGSWRVFLDELDRNIYKLKNGKMFSSWQTYYTWLNGAVGLPLDYVLTNLTVRAPYLRVGLAADGLNVS